MVQTVSNEDLAAMVVTLSADLSKYSKEMSKVAGIAEKSMKGAERAVISANDNMVRNTQKGAEQMGRAYRAAGANAANMASQVQDIGIQLASGTSPLTVALQQGTQIGQVFTQAAQQGGSAVSVLVGALRNLLTVTSLAPIAIIAIGGALLQAFSGPGKKSVEDIIKDLKDLRDIAEATGANALAVRVQAEIDEEQVKQITKRLQDLINAELDKIGARPTTGIDKFLENLDAGFNRAAVAFGDMLRDAFRAAPVGGLGGPISELFDTIEADAPGAAEKAKEFNDAFTDLTESLKEGQEDPARAAAALERLAAIDLSMFDEAARSRFLEQFAAALPAIQESIAKIKELKEARDNANKATESAIKKEKDYQAAIKQLEAAGVAKHLSDVEQLYQAWVKADAAATTYGQKQEAITKFNLGQQNLYNEAIAEGQKGTVDLIKKFEGFRPTAYWDVNAFRVGFGSDTFVDQMGNVQKVTQDTVVTVEQAMADLMRRIPEFQGIVQRSLGSEFWNKLNQDQQAALTSLVYNYGKVPAAVVEAVRRGGGAEAIANAIAGLGSDNKGINRVRRQAEAALFGGDSFKTLQGLQEQAAEKERLVAVTKEEIAIENDLSLTYVQQQGAIARLRAEKEAYYEATKDGSSVNEQEAETIRKIGDAAYATAAAQAQQTVEQRNNTIWAKQGVEANKQLIKSQEELAKQQQQNAQLFAQLGSSFINTFVNGLKQGKSAAESFKEALIGLAEQLLQLLLMKSLTSLGNALFPAAQIGGPVGGPAHSRRLSPLAFVGAPRMATGGMIGVRPGEYPTILHKGEVVIPARMVRQAARMGSGSSGGQGTTTIRIGDVSIETTLEGRGDVQADTQRGREFGLRVQALVQSEIQRQSRPGGILTAQGSAGRVGR